MRFIQDIESAIHIAARSELMSVATLSNIDATLDPIEPGQYAQMDRLSPVAAIPYEVGCAKQLEVISSDGRRRRFQAVRSNEFIEGKATVANFPALQSHLEYGDDKESSLKEVEAVMVGKTLFLEDGINPAWYNIEKIESAMQRHLPSPRRTTPHVLERVHIFADALSSLRRSHRFVEESDLPDDLSEFPF